MIQAIRNRHVGAIIEKNYPLTTQTPADQAREQPVVAAAAAAVAEEHIRPDPESFHHARVIALLHASLIYTPYSAVDLLSVDLAFRRLTNKTNYYTIISTIYLVTPSTHITKLYHYNTT